MDIPGVNINDQSASITTNYDVKEKVYRILEGRLRNVETDKDGWTNHIDPFDIRKMVHAIVFVVATEELTKESVRKAYKELKAKFSSYKEYGLEGYTPFLVITKADESNAMTKADLKKYTITSTFRSSVRNFVTQQTFQLNARFSFPIIVLGLILQKIT